MTNFKFSRDLLGGLVVTGVGAAFLAGSLGMRIGSGTNMGPGFFPFACSIITLLLGFWIAAEGLRNHVVIETPEWRQALAILAAISVFAVMLEAFGLIPAVITGSLVASLGDSTSRPAEAVILAIGTAIACWLIFRVGLGLQMPGFRLPSWPG